MSGRLAVLHLAVDISETCPTYNEHCLPLIGRRELGVCTYFPTAIQTAPQIALYDGDGTLGGFYRALRAALAARRYDVIHAHAPHFALLLMLARLGGVRAPYPKVFTVHNSFPNFKFRNKLLLLLVAAYAQRTVCCSRASEASFPAVYRRLSGQRFTAVPNGVDTDRVDTCLRRVPADGDAARRAAGKERPFTVVSAGRLIAIKNPATVLHAFGRAAGDDARLLFVGAGGLDQSLRRQRSALGLDARVVLTGLLPREQVFERLAAADLFVSASYGEGLPIATLEAMASGCPVLLSDIPPHREIAAGVDFVPLVPPDDVAGFARHIARFRRLSAADRAAVGQRCRELVRRRFSLSAMHDAYRRVYRQVIAETPAPGGSRPAV